jgi:hypothetical protein
MVLQRRNRPTAWDERKKTVRFRILLPFFALEWVWDWVAYALSNWRFIDVLEYLETFSVLVAVIFYFSETGARIKQRHYQAWQVINTAQGKGGSGGRIEALQALNADRVPLVGVDVSSAFLQGVVLAGANLTRSDFSSADMRNSNLSGANLTFANLNSTNLRGGNLDHCTLENANLRDADLNGASLIDADLNGAELDNADLRNADLEKLQWKHLKGMNGTNIAGVRNAPEGFQAWAIQNGAVSRPDQP